jgi:hypothetical protein
MRLASTGWVSCCSSSERLLRSPVSELPGAEARQLRVRFAGDGQIGGVAGG